MIEPQEVGGIPCYSPENLENKHDYPSQHFEKLFDLEGKHFWFRSRSRVIECLIKKYLGNRQGDFLEIGCGTGFVLMGISKFQNLALWGAELHLEGLKFAQKRLPQIKFLQVDAREMPFKNKFFGIGAFDVLEHIEEDHLVVKNIYDALIEGGCFFITVPQHKWLWSSQDNAAFHKRRYIRKDMRNLLQNAGFQVEYMSSFVFFLLPLMFLSRKKIDDSEKRNESTEYDFVELEISKWTSRILEIFMKFDELLIRLGISLPIGGSLVVVARKPQKKDL